jgi:NADH-quinone oxidoreductase subunit H
MRADAPAPAVPDLAALLRGLPGLDALPPAVFWPLAMLLVATLVVLFISVFDLFAVWLERKLSARIQCRLGPMEVGPLSLVDALRARLGAAPASRLGQPTLVGGLLQTAADALKLLAKEDVVPAGADRALYVVGPCIVLLGVFGIFVVLPFGPSLVATDMDLGLFYVAAVGSLEAIGIMMSGWASNNKWSLFGTMRAATQVVAYEIPLSLSFVAVIAVAGTFSLVEICDQQRGGLWTWYLLANPFTAVAFAIYFIAGLAQAKRAPFDLPEAESELVSGFHTEYSGMRFSIFFLSEYAAMYAIAAVASVVFLGGYYTGVPPVDRWIHDARAGAAANAVGFAALVGKAVLLVGLQMMLRWTLPRIRLDQIFSLCLKVLLPFAIACVVGASLWQMALGDHALLFLAR